MTHWKRYIIFILGNCLLLLLLSACLGSETTTSTETGTTRVFGSAQTLPAGNATLRCSDDCYDRAQCGKNAEQQNVVLLSTIAPAVTGHNLWQANNTVVTIVQSQPRTVQKLQTNEEYAIDFYQVTLPDTQSAWVAGWCIFQEN